MAVQWETNIRLRALSGTSIFKTSNSSIKYRKVINRSRKQNGKWRERTHWHFHTTLVVPDNTMCPVTLCAMLHILSFCQSVLLFHFGKNGKKIGKKKKKKLSRLNKQDHTQPLLLPKNIHSLRKNTKSSKVMKT